MDEKEWIEFGNQLMKSITVEIQTKSPGQTKSPWQTISVIKYCQICEKQFEITGRQMKHHQGKLKLCFDCDKGK